MAQLIAMRQRIKAVETIKKVTDAMRLISMSTHTHLRNKEESLKEYEHEIVRLFAKINSPISHSIDEPEEQSQEKKAVIILVGSQKSLCGHFKSAKIILHGSYRYWQRSGSVLQRKQSSSTPNIY